jgi:hypothetical protein
VLWRLNTDTQGGRGWELHVWITCTDYMYGLLCTASCTASGHCYMGFRRTAVGGYLGEKESGGFLPRPCYSIPAATLASRIRARPCLAHVGVTRASRCFRCASITVYCALKSDTPSEVSKRIARRTRENSERFRLRRYVA